MMTFFSIIGILTCLATCVVVIILTSEYRNDEKVFTVVFLGFGIIRPKEEAVLKMFNQFRKSEGKKTFINTPTWFNKYVYNFGVRK